MNDLREFKQLLRAIGEKLLERKKPDREPSFKLLDFLRKNRKISVEEIFLKKNPEILVTISEALSQLLVANGVSSNRIRNVFGYIKKLEADTLTSKDKLSEDTYHKLRLLSPKLAYIIGRSRDKEEEALRVLKDYFDESIEKIEYDKKKFKTFVDFFEAILSYHKYYKGK